MLLCFDADCRDCEASMQLSSFNPKVQTAFVHWYHSGGSELSASSSASTSLRLACQPGPDPVGLVCSALAPRQISRWRIRVARFHALLLQLLLTVCHILVQHFVWQSLLPAAYLHWKFPSGTPAIYLQAFLLQAWLFPIVMLHAKCILLCRIILL